MSKVQFDKVRRPDGRIDRPRVFNVDEVMVLWIKDKRKRDAPWRHKADRQPPAIGALRPGQLTNAILSFPHPTHPRQPLDRPWPVSFKSSFRLMGTVQQRPLL